MEQKANGNVSSGKFVDAHLEISTCVKEKIIVFEQNPSNYGKNQKVDVDLAVLTPILGQIL